MGLLPLSLLPSTDTSSWHGTLQSHSCMSLLWSAERSRPKLNPNRGSPHAPLCQKCGGCEEPLLVLHAPECKLKKANGEILECTRVFEKKPDLIKNYGIFFRYDSRTGTHNMY